MKANASKRKIFDAVDMLTENTSAKTTEVKAENGVEQIAIDSIDTPVKEVGGEHCMSLRSFRF